MTDETNETPKPPPTKIFPSATDKKEVKSADFVGSWPALTSGR